ncbi:MAG: metallophosphoesterase [Nocardioidaceae bacterium]
MTTFSRFAAFRDTSQVRRLTSYLREHRPRSWRHGALLIIGYVAGWAVIAVPVAYALFLHAERPAVIAGNDVTVSPTRDGWATFDLGAFLPDVRYPTDRTLGVHVDVGATTLDNYDSLIQRYAVLASQPQGEISKVTELVHDMAYAAAFQGAVIGLAGPALWLLVGRRRRRELARALTPRRAILGVALAALVVGVSASQPFENRQSPASISASSGWQPIAALVPEANVSGQAARLQIQGGLITSGTQDLVSSAFATYRKSVTFYNDLADRAPALADLLHQPGNQEVVALLVSDRHDNVGMDPVSRAIGDAGGATVLFDAGDDTSTGETWEAFSLDSVSKAFDDYAARYGVAGNHDNGTFAGDYLADLGFVMLTGDPITGEAGIRLLGAPDPRSSGLGSGIRPTAVPFDEQATELADVACAADANGKRVTTLLVHDRNLGAAALDRGCVDLVLSGHLHIQAGPTTVTGSNGSVGTTYTNGTTGGAAYAFALGSKLRRDAEVTLITYRDRRPVGLQPVTIRTTGEYVVAPYVELPAAGDQASGG